MPVMRIIDPQTGRAYLEKRRQRYPVPRQPRELTFSCYRRLPFLAAPRVREWFREALEGARSKCGFQVWAYVLMPEHAHLIIYPGEAPEQMSRFLQALKEPVARKAVAFLKANDPAWLARLTVREGLRVRHRIWQPGGGYDRNIRRTSTLRSMVEYLHGNPVRRELVAKAEDWEWSSARWYAGMRPVPIAMDLTVLEELSREGKRWAER